MKRVVTCDDDIVLFTVCFITLLCEIAALQSSCYIYDECFKCMKVKSYNYQALYDASLLQSQIFYIS